MRRPIARAVSQLLIALLSGACASASFSTPRVAADAGSIAYVFSDIRVDAANQTAGTVEVWWSTRWATSEFPGVRSCTWRVLDGAGQELGSHSETFVGLNPTAPPS